MLLKSWLRSVRASRCATSIKRVASRSSRRPRRRSQTLGQSNLQGPFAVATESLEDRALLTALTENNILVTRASFLDSDTDAVIEYSPNGQVVQQFELPGTDGFSSLISKDLVVDAAGNVHVFSENRAGGVNLVHMTNLNPVTGGFTTINVPNWGIAYTWNHWGDLAAFGQFIYAVEHLDNDGTANGIIRFDLQTQTTQRFVTPFGAPTDLTVGLDGLLYVTVAGLSETDVRVLNPVTMQPVRAVQFNQRLLSLAVDANGTFFATSDTGLKRFNSAGTSTGSTLAVSGSHIDINRNGTKLVLSGDPSLGTIGLINTDFTGASSFNLPTGQFAFATFVQAPVLIQAPTPSAPDLVPASDAGVSDSDNLTNSRTPTFQGTSAPNALVELLEGANVIASGAANAQGNWLLTVPSPMPPGPHSLRARIQNGNGFVSQQSPPLNMTIDVRAPTLAITPNGIATNHQSIVFTFQFSEPVAGFTADDVTLTNATAGTFTVVDGDTYRLRVAPIADGAVTVSVAAHSAHDFAGNNQTPGASVTVTSDTQAPDVPSPPDLLSTSDTGVSDQDDLTNDATPTFGGTANPHAIIDLLEGNTVLVSGQANPSGEWFLTLPAAIPHGEHTLRAVARDVAGNVSAASSTLRILVDRFGPNAPTRPDLADESDTGGSNSDNITSDTTPTFTGTVEPNADVRLFEGSAVLAAGRANSEGVWTLTTQVLPSGPHLVTARATDPAGNVSPISAALTFTIDTQAPNPPSPPDLIASSDTGASQTDNLTNDSTPTIAGTAEPHSHISLLQADAVLATGQANANGQWSVTIATELAEGAHVIHAQATDAVGNVSDDSGTLTINVDTQAPNVPAALDLIDDSDTGIANDDNLTGDDTPTLSGTAEGNSLVHLMEGSTVLVSGHANGDGEWQLTTNALTDGEHTLTARSRDAAGNVSDATESLTIVIDTAAPAAPSSPDLAAVSDSGQSDTDNITNVVLPTFTGTAEAHSAVALFEGDNLLGSGQANSEGAWSITLTESLTVGEHVIDAEATDSAHNTSSSSATLTVTIDVDGPTFSISPDSVTTGEESVVFTIEANEPVTSFIADDVTVTNGVAGEFSYLDSQVATLIVATETDGLVLVSIPDDAAEDVAGNLSSGRTASITKSSDVPTIPSAPNLFANSDTGASTSDNITNDTTPTFDGTSEADLTIHLFVDGEEEASVGADGNGNWSATLTTELTEGQHTITARAENAIGNLSQNSGTLTITIDTTSPTPLITPNSGTLSGSELAYSVDFQESVTGFVQTDVTVVNGTAGALSSTTDNLYEFPVVPNGDGQLSVTVGAGVAHDLAGNANNQATSTVTVDNTAPGVPSTPDLIAAADSGVSQTDNVTADRLAFIGTADPNVLVQILEGQRILAQTISAANGDWNVSIADDVILTEGDHDIVARTSDFTGNISASSTPLTVTIDTLPPAITITPNSGINTDDTILFVIEFSEDAAGLDAADVTVTNGTAGELVRRGNRFSLEVTPTSVGEVTVSVAAAAVTDLAGNSSILTRATIFSDNQPPGVPSTPDLHAVSDTGASRIDNVTSVAAPVFTGTSDASTRIELLVDDAVVSTGMSNANGHWILSVPAANPLVDGTHIITVRAIDDVNNASVSSSLTVVIDTIAPDVPSTPDLTDRSDSGVSNTDNLTNIVTPSFQGTAEPGVSVDVLSRTSVLTSGRTDSNGIWDLQIARVAALEHGDHLVRARARDVAGNLSDESGLLLFSIDTIGLAAPTTPDLVDGSDTGESQTDNITLVRTPTFRGTAEPNSPVELLEGTTVLAAATSNANGHWSLTVREDARLSRGDHAVRARVRDIAGNPTDSSPLTITILIGAGFTVTESNGSTVVSEAGGVDTVSVVLDAPPIDTVTLVVRSGDVSEVAVSPRVLVFTSENWDRSQVITLTGQPDDRVSDGDARTHVTIGVNAALSDSDYHNVAPVSVDVVNRSHVAQRPVVLNGRGRHTDFVDVRSINANPNFDVELRAPDGRILSPGGRGRISLAGFPAGTYEIWANDPNFIVTLSPHFGEAPGEPEIQPLDLDGNGAFDFATDGVLLLGYVLGAEGVNLEAFRAPGDNRTGAEIQTVIEQLADSLDLDGDGEFNFATDAIILLAHVLGNPSDQLPQFASNNATRDGQQISDRLSGLLSKAAAARGQSPDPVSYGASDVSVTDVIFTLPEHASGTWGARPAIGSSVVVVVIEDGDEIAFTPGQLSMDLTESLDSVALDEVFSAPDELGSLVLLPTNGAITGGVFDERL